MLWLSLCVLALAVLLFAEFGQYFKLKVIAKLAASSFFVAAALSWGATEYAYGKWILAGLALCWLGDALLLPEGSGKAFLAGLVAFLFGHVCYAAAFSQLPLSGRSALVAVFFSALLGFAVLRRLWPALPENMRHAVPIYVVVILAMVVFACAASGAGAPAILAVGAIGFAASDLAVARERFIVLNFTNRAWGLPAYYLSQLCLAYSVYLVHTEYLPELG